VTCTSATVNHPAGATPASEMMKPRPEETEQVTPLTCD
jgi:hypothetical protein